MINNRFAGSEVIWRGTFDEFLLDFVKIASLVDLATRIPWDNRRNLGFFKSGLTKWLREKDPYLFLPIILPEESSGITCTRLLEQKNHYTTTNNNTHNQITATSEQQ
jgi:hypothetical protein